MFLGRVPNDPAVEANGYFADVAESVRAHGLVDVTNGIDPASDAIQEIADMIATSDEFHLERVGVLVDEVFLPQIDTFTIDVGPTLGALESGPVGGNPAIALLPFIPMQPRIGGRLVLIAAVGEAHIFHRDAASKFHVDFPNRRRVAGPFAVKCASAFDLDGATK